MAKTDDEIKDMYESYLQEGKEGLTKAETSDAMFDLQHNPTAVDFALHWPGEKCEIGLEEFTKFYKDLGDPEQKVKDALEKAFKMFDKDENGVITKDELKAFMQAAALSKDDMVYSDDAEDKKLIDDVFKDCDEDNSEGLSIEEFVNIIQHGWRPELIPPDQH